MSKCRQRYNLTVRGMAELMQTYIDKCRILSIRKKQKPHIEFGGPLLL